MAAKSKQRAPLKIRMNTSLASAQSNTSFGQEIAEADEVFTAVEMSRMVRSGEAKRLEGDLVPREETDPESEPEENAGEGEE